MLKIINLMTAQKKKYPNKRKYIVIATLDTKIYDFVCNKAKELKNSNGKAAEWIIEQYKNLI